MDFVEIVIKCYNFLKSLEFEFLGVNLNFIDLFVGGTLLYLVWYMIFKVGD